MVAAILTLLFSFFSTSEYQWIEGLSIIFGVFFLALFSASANQVKQRQKLRQYEEIQSEEVSVVRGQYGLSQPCRVFDIVVGDVIIIEPGMRIPADCVLFSGIDITVDETIYCEGRETIVKK